LSLHWADAAAARQISISADPAAMNTKRMAGDPHQRFAKNGPRP
jgi:hypothetical protein